MIKILGLSSISEKRFGELSQGQKRQVIIARALVIQPEVLIMDEPTCNLDLKSKIILIKFLETLTKTSTTIVQVTHDLESILKSTTRVIMMKNCNVIYDNSPSKILTSEIVSYLYDVQIEIQNNNGYYRAFPVN